MPSVVVRELVTSATARNRDGSAKQYAVSLLDDGTGACTCPAFMIHGVNSPSGQDAEGRIVYRCKHLQAIAARVGAVGPPSPEAGQSPRPPAPASPRSAPSGLGLDDLDLTRRGRRARRDLSL